MALEGFHASYIMLRAFSNPAGHGRWYLATQKGIGCVLNLSAHCYSNLLETCVQSHQLCFVNKYGTYWFLLERFVVSLT